MTSCGEMPEYSNLTTITDNGSNSSMLTMKILPAGEQERVPASSMQCVSDQSKGLFYPAENPTRVFELARDSDLLAIAPTASPENIVDQILESIDSDSDGIFIDFGQNCSGSPGYSMDVSRQSVV
ncbi:proline-rich protein 5-like [Erythrolamprus reginae]|uniref:proline-rich protein 5-like n=1 Tax=Erythrolamprus reginae TaxID=121349 RepID=UPI00396CA62D